MPYLRFRDTKGSENQEVFPVFVEKLLGQRVTRTVHSYMQSWFIPLDADTHIFVSEIATYLVALSQTLLGMLPKNSRCIFLNPKKFEYGNTCDSKDSDKQLRSLKKMKINNCVF